MDSSAKLLELAAARLGDGADLRVADPRDPLPFADGAFDGAIAALVLHYLKDWTAPLRELRRILTPGGRLIVAVNHPFIYKLIKPDADYFAINEWSVRYTFGGHDVILSHWHRPLNVITTAFTQAGFHITGISDASSRTGRG